MKKQGKTEKQTITSEKQFSFPLWDKYFSFKEQCWLFVLVIIGTLLRVINAIYTPLWRDEIYIFFIARNNSLWKLITQQHWDTAHPPLHSIFLHFWQMISIQPLWLRLPSLISSFFILYLIPILAIKIIKKHRFFPFIFLFLFSISHTQISLNMVVRPYPFVILLMISSILLFFSIQERGKKKDIFLFVLVNLVMVFFDYSAFWLFATYLFFFPVYYIFKRNKKSSLHNVFIGLILSAACSATVFPFLFGNIHNSLYLERFVSPIISQEKSISHGETVYIYVERNKHTFTIYDGKLNLVKSAKTSIDPFPENKIYAGLDLSPLSLLSINDYSICATKTLAKDIQDIVSSCKYMSFSKPLSSLIHESSPRILDFFSKTSLHIVNTTLGSWNTDMYKETIDFKPTDNIVIKVNFSSNSLLYRSGINILGKVSQDTDSWWKNISRLTISTFEGQYRIVYYDGTSSEPQNIFGDRGLLERFWYDLRFMTGFPYDKQVFILLIATFSLIVLSQFVLLQQAIFFRENRVLFMSFLFFIPVGLSLLISYYFVPIFVGRNIHLSNVSYLFGASLFIATLISSKNKSAQLIARLFGSSIILVYFVLFIVRFPYIHYVDPPYNVGKVLNTIDDKHQNRKKLVILGNEDFYVPLLQYPVLLSGQANNVVIATTERISRERQFGKDLFNLSAEERQSIFFIRFNRFGEENSEHDFIKFARVFGCGQLRQIEIPYIYFARCE